MIVLAMFMLMVMVIRQMDVELYSFNRAFLLSARVEVIAIQSELR